MRRFFQSLVLFLLLFPVVGTAQNLEIVNAWLGIIEEVDTSGIPRDYSLALNFSSGFADRSPNAHTATVVNATVANGVARFDGVDDYVYYDDGLFQVGTNSVTLSVWIMPTAAQPEGYAGIVGKSLSGSARGAGINLNANKPSAQFRTPTFYNLEYTNAISVSNWMHVACTYDRSGEMTMYVDGCYYTNVSISADASTNLLDSIQFVIGSRSDVVNNKAYDYKGWLDNLYLYWRALNTNEIYALYNEGHD